MYEDTHFSRYAMYKAIEQWCSNNQLPFGIGKTVGGESVIRKLYPNVSWEVTDIKTGVNAENMPWPKSSIDILISDQMLEHVEHPWTVRDEIGRVVKRGGILILTTCFLQPHHGTLYFEFHQEGLKSLFNRDFSCVVGGWGNREANELINWSDKRFASVKDDENLKRLTEINDYKAPIHTWVMGKKR